MPLWELLKQPLVSDAEANVPGQVVEISRGTWSGGCRKGWTSWNLRERSLNLHCTPPGPFRVLSPSPGLQPGWAAFIQTLLSYRVYAPSAPIKATTIPTPVPSQPRQDTCWLTRPHHRGRTSVPSTAHKAHDMLRPREVWGPEPRAGRGGLRSTATWSMGTACVVATHSRWQPRTPALPAILFLSTFHQKLSLSWEDMPHFKSENHIKPNQTKPKVFLCRSEYLSPRITIQVLGCDPEINLATGFSK